MRSYRAFYRLPGCVRDESTTTKAEDRRGAARRVRERFRVTGRQIIIRGIKED